jgi:hypothetical protein
MLLLLVKLIRYKFIVKWWGSWPRPMFIRFLMGWCGCKPECSLGYWDGTSLRLIDFWKWRAIISLWSKFNIKWLLSTWWLKVIKNVVFVLYIDPWTLRCLSLWCCLYQWLQILRCLVETRNSIENILQCWMKLRLVGSLSGPFVLP